MRSLFKIIKGRKIGVSFGDQWPKVPLRKIFRKEKPFSTVVSGIPSLGSIKDFLSFRLPLFHSIRGLSNGKEKGSYSKGNASVSGVGSVVGATQVDQEGSKCSFLP